MLNSLPVILFTGTVLGFLSGLGIGGGSLLILWLTVVLDMAPAAARTVNLLFFLPAAVISCGLRLKNGTLKLKPILPAIAAGCIGAFLFSYLGSRMDTSLLKKLFGTVLIAAGIREVFYRPRKAR